MSSRDRDEEKALLEAYYDDETQQKPLDEPPSYTREELDDDRAAQRKLRRKRCLRKMGRHLAIFSFLFFVWQMVLRPATRGGGCRGMQRPEIADSFMADFAWDENKEPPADEFPWPPALTVEECTEWPQPDHGHDWDHRDGHGHGHHRHGHDHDHDHRRHEHTFNSSFSLPASSDALGFFARGPWSIGTLNVEQGTEETDQVMVDVTTRWNGPKYVLNFVQLCKFKREEGEVGVGIVSKKGRRHPHHHHRHHKIRFDVNVRLPPSSDKQLEIKKLVTWLPVFAQNFGDLGKNVHFDTVALYGSVSAIHAESLSAKNTTVVAAIGGIKGNFTASSHLELVTASGEIDANVGLINDEESDEWTNLVLKTAVSTTRANISLSTASSGEGGKFNITSTTHSGHVTLDTLTAPPKSTVDLSVAGSVGSINVAVHKTFEGRFDASTSVISKPTIVEPKEKEEDGKERKVDYEQVGRGVARGSVWWEGDDGDSSGKERGIVRLSNSFGNIVLKL